MVNHGNPNSSSLISGFSGPWNDGPMDGFEGGPPPFGGPSPFGGNDQGGFGDFDE